MTESTNRFRKPSLSLVDKKILKVLLDPDGKISSEKLSKILHVPRTTIQRRRKLLENHFVQINYSLNLENLGHRRVDLLIATENGKTLTVSQNLLKRDEVVYVGRTVGQHTIDLKAEVVIKDNSELLDLLETVKSMEGVRDAQWTETVKVIGRKKSIPNSVIDKL